MKRSRIKRKPSRDRAEWIAARDAQLAREPSCKACGSTVGLHVHHAGRRQGVGRRSHDVPLWTLCWLHHREFHDAGRATFCERYGIEDEE